MKVAVFLVLLPALVCALVCLVVHFRVILRNYVLLQLLSDVSISVSLLGLPVGAWLFGVRSWQDANDLPGYALVAAASWAVLWLWTAYELRCIPRRLAQSARDQDC